MGGSLFKWGCRKKIQLVCRSMKILDAHLNDLLLFVL